MDLNAIGLFTVAARAGSLSEASRQTGVALPTLSRRVRRLEAELGVRLFDRGRKGLRLTPAGARLMQDVLPAITSLNQAEQRLYDPSGIAGTLRLSIPPHFEPLWPFLSEFSGRYPAVRFDVLVGDRLVDLVEEGIDVAVRIGEGGSGSYIGRTLTRYRHIAVASPEFLERHTLQEPQDMRSMPCACWRGTGPSVWSLGGEQVGLEPVLVTNDYQHLARIAIAGEAATELPPFLARPLLRRGILAPVLPDFPMPEQLVRAVIAERRLVSPLVERFLDDASTRLPTIFASG